MEKLGREKILSIGNSILAESDVVAVHGTSISNADSIMNTGFNYNRTSMAFGNKDAVVGLCTYGWKENKAGDAANVVISVPKSFFKALMGFDDKKYEEWINRIKDDKEFLVASLCDMNFSSQMGLSNVGFLNKHLPKEFIKGMFIYTDNKTSLSFLNNKEEGLDYLTYIDNPNFYENLDEEEKAKFVEDMKIKILGPKGPRQGGR